VTRFRGNGAALLFGFSIPRQSLEKPQENAMMRQKRILQCRIT
jgi:hypothetical protein